jgi:hypothetical protein
VSHQPTEFQREDQTMDAIFELLNVTYLMWHVKFTLLLAIIGIVVGQSLGGGVNTITLAVVAVAIGAKIDIDRA